MRATFSWVEGTVEGGLRWHHDMYAIFDTELSTSGPVFNTNRIVETFDYLLYSYVIMISVSILFQKLNPYHKLDLHSQIYFQYHQ